MLGVTDWLVVCLCFSGSKEGRCSRDLLSFLMLAPLIMTVEGPEQFVGTADDSKSDGPTLG